MRPRAYYNENDPFVAQWLRALVDANLIAPGYVDDRSIIDVRAGELRGFTQCHFFAGIGGWSAALRRAGWSDARPVWTGSCPCQPWSAAGKNAEFADERHLWPAWFRLIRESRPDVIVGEQVSDRRALVWLDHVRADLESEAYAVGVLDSSAAGVGAPHRRQRLYFVADHDQRGRGVERPAWIHEQGQRRDHVARCGADGDAQGDMVNDQLARLEGHGGDGDLGDQPRRITPTARRSARAAGPVGGFWSDAEWLACRDGLARCVEPGAQPLAHGVPSRVGRLRAYGNAVVVPQAAAFIAAYLTL